MENEMELFKQKENMMTTKELAKTLGVDASTIKKTVTRLEEGGEVLHHLTHDKYNNKCFLFDEKQATLIKREIQKHHNLASRQIDSVSTECLVIGKFPELFLQLGELYGIRIGLLSCNQIFNGGVESFGNIISLECVGINLSSYPPSECLVWNIAGFGNCLLFCISCLYKRVDSFPEICGMFFHTFIFGTKSFNNRTFYIDKVLLLSYYQIEKFQY